MVRVTIQFPMWLGKELGPEWVSPTDVRATMTTEIPEGTKVRQFLGSLADRYPPIREKIFPDHQLAPYVVATLNGRGLDRNELLETVLSESDVITILPIVVGG